MIHVYWLHQLFQSLSQMIHKIDTYHLHNCYNKSNSQYSQKMDQVRRRYSDNSTSSEIHAVEKKFVPQYFAQTENQDACNSHQAYVVACMEKANRDGTNCNHAFTKWNACLAKDCGYTRAAAE